MKLLALAASLPPLLAPAVVGADPSNDAAHGVAKLSAAIRAKDAAQITAHLYTVVQTGGLPFADAACERFAKRSKAIESNEHLALARCLAQWKLQTTTRRSGTPGMVVLTVDPGIELELIFTGDRVQWLGYAHGNATPTMTAQAFEALRSAGSTNVDAGVKAAFEAKYARDKVPVSAWIQTCVDAKGTVSSKDLWSSTPGAGTAFLAAIAGWKFKAPTVRGGSACGHTLLTYPAAKAPATEVLPAYTAAVALARPRVVKDIVQPMKIEKIEKTYEPDPDGDEWGEEGGEIGGVVGGDIGVVSPPPPPPPPPPSLPQNIPPAALESLRVKGNNQIVPDDVTKIEIARAGKDKVVGSYKLCVTAAGAVSVVTPLKSTGFAAYDAKLVGEMKAWGYKPYMVNGKAVPVCTAVTFIYSQTTPTPPPPPAKKP
ncbi:MAG: hypothetical protein KIT31_07795 [Deltaproteobacteria bacterium]|nr:hypothetical protein [Deltaproteobacteria bacterium]